MLHPTVRALVSSFHAVQACSSQAADVICLPGSDSTAMRAFVLFISVPGLSMLMVNR
jgi:hypothetical protein